MTIEKSIIITGIILACAYIISPIALEAFKMKQCIDTGREAQTCSIIINKK